MVDLDVIFSEGHFTVWPRAKMGGALTTHEKAVSWKLKLKFVWSGPSKSSVKTYMTGLSTK